MEKNCMTDIYKTYKKDTDKSFDEDFDTGNTYYDDDYIESENENDDKYLEEDTHARYAKPAGDKTASYNNALTYAKKENKPFIYGYSNHDGKFFALEQPIKCVDLNKQTAEFKSKYKNCKVVYVAYPDKDYIKEDLDNNTEKNDMTFDEFLDKAEFILVDDAESFDINEFEKDIQDEVDEAFGEEDTENKFKIYINAYIDGIVNEDYLPSGTFEDKYDDQTIEEWNDFVNNVETLIEKQGDITNISHSANKNSLSTYIDFLLNNAVEPGIIDLRISDHKQTTDARNIRRKHAKKLDPNARFLSIIVNDKTFNSYSDALNYLQKLLDSYKNKEQNNNITESNIENKYLENKESITEDYNNMDYLFDKLNYYANNDSTSLDMDLLNSVLKEEKIEESYEDNKKRKALEYYNKIKDWASDAKARTSCIYNIDSNLLNEWIGDDK